MFTFIIPPIDRTSLKDLNICCGDGKGTGDDGMSLLANELQYCNLTVLYLTMDLSIKSVFHVYISMLLIG